MVERRVINRDDSFAFSNIYLTTVSKHLSPMLSPLTLPDGEGYFDVNPREVVDGDVRDDFGKPKRIIYIQADGQVTVRVDDMGTADLDAWLTFLLLGHFVADQVFQHLRRGPRGRVEIALALGQNRAMTTPRLPTRFEDYVRVDYSAQTFAETFTPSVMQCLRYEAGPPDEDAVTHALNKTFKKYFGDTDFLTYWR